MIFYLFAADSELIKRLDASEATEVSGWRSLLSTSAGGSEK